MVTKWSNKAKAELKKAYLYIAIDSLQHAETVVNEIIDKTIDLCASPEKHTLDKYKKDNDGSWRAFEIHHYRVSYRVTTNEIRIVRMRHTKKSPTNY